jgi:hypothetical protein
LALLGALVTVVGGAVTVVGGAVTVVGGSVTVAGGAVVGVEPVSGTADVSGDTEADGEEPDEVPGLHAVKNMTSPTLVTSAHF